MSIGFPYLRTSPYHPSFGLDFMKSTDLLERVFPGRRGELKRAILRQALLSFNAQGIEATTIEAIRSECGASVGAVYHHFQSKEGVVAALFFAALDDQERLREEYLRSAASAEEGIHALVHSYLDWVEEQPEWARFLLQARSVVSTGPLKSELACRNKQLHKKLHAWMSSLSGMDALLHIPAELLPSLIIGQSESYSRAWLSGRVRKSPKHYRKLLAKAAWDSVKMAVA